VHIVHIVARIALGGVFVVAGGSKVASGAAWPLQAAQLGVAVPVATVVPWFELIVGALVAVGVGEPWPAVVALAALAAFTLALVRTLRLGQRPPCACFGTWSAKPLGFSHVARNGGFAALAVLVLATN
jgi:uncharacterized membrane protein YphA (DoxX/SURF4 family)